MDEFSTALGRWMRPLSERSLSYDKATGSFGGRSTDWEKAAKAASAAKRPAGPSNPKPAPKAAAKDDDAPEVELGGEVELDKGSASAVKKDALVAKLRKQKGVRDPEALAAWIGRRVGGLSKDTKNITKEHRRPVTALVIEGFTLLEATRSRCPNGSRKDPRSGTCMASTKAQYASAYRAHQKKNTPETRKAADTAMVAHFQAKAEKHAAKAEKYKAAGKHAQAAKAEFHAQNARATAELARTQGVH